MMKTEQQQNTPQWLPLRYKETKWNTFYDAQDLADTELSDVQNISYDKGYPSPRKGSKLKWAKPAGETNALLCLFPVRASDGTNYAIACYAPNFYLRDEVNDQWVQINDTYTPSTTYKDLMYGFKSWNAGIGSDVFYAGNGTESAIKWQIGVGYVKTAYTSGGLSLVLDDTTKFPATGTIVVQEVGQSPIYSAYSANSSNTLTVTDLGANVAKGACVTFQIIEATTVAKGKIFLGFNRRLIVANQLGGECSIFGSIFGDPEDFTHDLTADSGFIITLPDGNGGIIGVDNFGEYLLVEKQDSLHKVIITYTQSTTDGSSWKNLQALPVAADISLGPVQPWARVKKNNLLYFATATEGIFQVNPDITGSQMSVKIDSISRDIKPNVEVLDFSNTRSTAFHQIVLFSATSQATGDTVLAFDILRGAWSKYTNWNVRDWLIHNETLYYGSRIDDNIYECFNDAKIDGDTPYDAYITTKRFDFGQGALPKTTGFVFVSGYIHPAEELFFDVILTTGDQIITTTYMLDGNGSLTVTSIPAALAMMMLGVSTLGGAQVESITGIFRAYLAIPMRYGFYTMQIKVYSRVKGTDWGLTGLGFSPWTEKKHSALQELGTVSDPTNANLQHSIFVQNNATVADTVTINGDARLIAAGSSSTWYYTGSFDLFWDTLLGFNSGTITIDDTRNFSYILTGDGISGVLCSGGPV